LVSEKNVRPDEGAAFWMILAARLARLRRAVHDQNLPTEQLPDPRCDIFKKSVLFKNLDKPIIQMMHGGAICGRK
jgi:hypothetical protein